MGKEPSYRTDAPSGRGQVVQGASEARGEVQGGPEPNVKGRLEGGAKASGAFLDNLRVPPVPGPVPIPASVKEPGFHECPTSAPANCSSVWVSGRTRWTARAGEWGGYHALLGPKEAGAEPGWEVAADTAGSRSPPRSGC